MQHNPYHEIFLRTGIAGKSAVQLAQDLIEQFGSLNNLLNASEEQFCRGNLYWRNI